MIRGLYISGIGMNVEAKRLNVISNDLANANTVGYKKDTAVLSSFQELMVTRLNDYQNQIPNNGKVGKMTFGAKVDDIYTQYTQGSVYKTENLSNVALQGDGFFQVNTPNGPAYTRDGSFVIDAEGNLVTQEGYLVAGENGPIQLGTEYLTSVSDLTITEQGDLFVAGEFVDRLKMVSFEDNHSLTKLGDNLYQGNGVTKPFTGSVIQGFLEASNVNPVTAMVDMITVARAYEANQKMVQVHDSLIGKAVNEVGRMS